jgi:transcriptional antiterminator RfaH
MLSERSSATVRPVITSPSSDASANFADKVSSERWYVAQTQPLAESRAIAHLERQGYNVFCPRYRKTVRHARKVRSVLAPLFPNYLFLHLDASRDQCRAVNGTRGVARLISQGDTLQPLPQGAIEDLLARTDTDGVINWTPAFKIGQAVRIVEGPFADIVGTLENLDAAGRVRVLLDLLGRKVVVASRCEALVAAA